MCRFFCSVRAGLSGKFTQKMEAKNGILLCGDLLALLIRVPGECGLLSRWGLGCLLATSMNICGRGWHFSKHSYINVKQPYLYRQMIVILCGPQ